MTSCRAQENAHKENAPWSAPDQELARAKPTDPSRQLILRHCDRHEQVDLWSLLRAPALGKYAHTHTTMKVKLHQEMPRELPPS